MTGRSPDGLTWRDVVFAALAATAWVAIVRPGPLSLPYFWDESDVYVPGARWVAEHGMVITPGVFPDDYSRGHPPLLYVLSALAFRAFGTSPVVGHLVVLPFTVLALACTYLLGTVLHRDRRAGLAAAVLLATTPLFLSIGNMLLPESPLTGLTALAFLFVARGQVGAAAACGVAMVWIKETGIFSAGAVGVAVLAEVISDRRRAALRVAIATVPLFALLAFFGWQRFYAGYYVFPHHQNLFADRPLSVRNLSTVWPSLLAWNGRAIATVGAVAARVAGIEGRLGVRARATTIGLFALIAFNAIFFTKMFWLERYALPAHVAVVVLVAGASTRGFAAIERPVWRTSLRFGPIVAASIVGVVSLRSPTPPDSEELTFAYADVIETHRAAFAELSPRDAPVLTTWPMTVELEEPYLGYITHPIASEHVAHWNPREPIGSILVNTASSRATQLTTHARERGMRRVATFQRGVAPALELYRAP